MNWKNYLKPEEVVELEALRKQTANAVAQRRKIYDRCRKRAAKADAE